MIRSAILVVVSIFSLQFTILQGYAQAGKNVRVAILQDARSVSLKINGKFTITDENADKVLYEGNVLKTTVTGYKNGFLLAGLNLNADRVLVKTSDPDTVIINNRVFRGNVKFIKDAADKITAINYIELEDYIKGISVRETSHYWPMDALKAQAIVFRTFALYRCQENKQKDYDLTNDVYSQVYGGKIAERYRINNAVDETKGIVLTYKGEILPAFYHATCAGHTEDASMLWGINLAPLKGVVCQFCKDSPHFSWHYDLSTKEVADKLKAAGFGFSDIKDIVIIGKDDSGRITELKISSDVNDAKISAKDFRGALGPDIIRSANFSVKIIDHDVVFEGFGWGHGVGLCQWGAYFMAKQGYKFDEILKYYYPGAEITKR